MKKIIIAFFAALMLMLPQAAMAASGDVAGFIYATDIRANINGVWVDSYSIDGKTVVILEDITDAYEYYDDLRVLVCNELDSFYLKEGTENIVRVHGKIIGYIYETDIKTYVNGKAVKCYALNGKMAVAIEDLGNDGVFSENGGRYFWNAEDRTITLETAYNNSGDVSKILHEKKLNMEINYDKGTVKFIPASSTECGKILTTGIQPIEFKYDGKTISRMFSTDYIRVVDNNGFNKLVTEGTMPIVYYNVEQIEELVKDM